MSKRISDDLRRAVKAIETWNDAPNAGRLDFHTQRQEQRMIDLCLNFVAKYHKQIDAMIAARETK